MAGIWRKAGEGWELAVPERYANEAALHDLVEQAPQLLPLSGAPDLHVLGREVQLASGYADLVAIETSGRPVVIEVKLRANSEARRAVVAQVLTYAACLRGLSVDQFNNVLAAPLGRQGATTATAAVGAADQTGGFDADAFESNLAESLQAGSFRLVIVLDEAPAELVRLVGYLESVAAGLTIDLICVTQYAVGDGAVVVPQRIDPDRIDEAPRAPKVQSDPGGFIVAGAADFQERISQARDDEQNHLLQLTQWALALEAEGLARLATYHGKGERRMTLLPRIQPDNVGLVTIYNEGGAAYLQLWRSVFERLAPASIAVVEAVLGGRLGQGNTTRDFSTELLSALAGAYREANGRAR